MIFSFFEVKKKILDLEKILDVHRRTGAGIMHTALELATQ